jgi:fructosamine-3-kinase
MMAQEPGIHRLLQEKTTVPVARIVAYDTSRKAIDRDFLIMERLPGKPMSAVGRCNVAKILHQVGQALAQAHTLTAGQYGYLGEHRPMEPKATWLEAFETMWGKLIEDIVATGHYGPRESDLMLSLLERHRAMFDRRVPASLLHMDVWSQNILVDSESNLTGLVDWDRALWGDPEIEFAVLDYCGISEPSFWEGYGVARDQSPEARTRQAFYFLYELQKYIVIRHGRSNDPASARQYKHQALLLAKERLG